MSTKRTILLSIAITLVVWAFCSWPLPRYAAVGIPSSSTNVENPPARYMIPGDHLQLLYNYWLVKDMFAGKTKWFHNLYEFNTGDDDERRYLGGDSVPFSLIYTIGHFIGGRAVGYNFMGLVSLWITFLTAWMLTRRYVKEDYSAAVTAAIAITLPYRWNALMGGSPTGLAMMAVPMWLLGLDMAIRDRRLSGGLLAALAVLFSYWNDAHIFYFGFLMTPCWGLLVFIHGRSMKWSSPRHWGKLILATLPFVAIMLLLVWQAMGRKAEDVPGSTVEQGRSMAEVALFSPPVMGLIKWRGEGHGQSVYVGVVLPVVLLVGLGFNLFLLWRRPKTQWRNAVTSILLLAGIAVSTALALGPNGPFGGRLFTLMHGRIPHYEMIRQPAKILAVVAPLLAVAAALALRAVIASLGRDSMVFGILCVALTVMQIDYGLQTRPTICLLDREQAAYEAVADDARERGKNPHALIVPIWPGDSAWSSLYEHYVSLYRIRMLNGYLPVVPHEYIRDIAVFFEFANVGILTDDRLDNLLERGVEYVLLHEDAFPEQVSTFPVAFTVKNLLNHPRLQFLKQGQNVWAFRVLQEPVEHPPVKPDWSLFLPSINSCMELEHAPSSGASILPVPSASGGHCLELATEDSIIHMHGFPHCHAEGGTLLLRGRGPGNLQAVMDFDNGVSTTNDVVFHSDNWEWHALPLGDLEDSNNIEPHLKRIEGTLHLDLALYFAGDNPSSLSPGQSLTIPAPLFFHAGYTDMEKNAVVLRAAYQPDDAIVYGPRLPLANGEYEVSLAYETKAPAGTQLGYFRVQNDLVQSEEFPVVVGLPTKGHFLTETNNLPVTLYFNYARAADMALRSVTFKRVE